MSSHFFQLALNKLAKPNLSAADRCLSAGRKWHQYLWRDLNNQFALEASPDQSLFYMTTQKYGVASGDYIEISGAEGSSQYQIIQLERYCEPSDMWIATLRKITRSLRYRRP